MEGNLLAKGIPRKKSGYSYFIGLLVLIFSVFFGIKSQAATTYDVPTLLKGAVVGGGYGTGWGSQESSWYSERQERWRYTYVLHDVYLPDDCYLSGSYIYLNNGKCVSNSTSKGSKILFCFF